jgi:hypothetical protein
MQYRARRSAVPLPVVFTYMLLSGKGQTATVTTMRCLCFDVMITTKAIISLVTVATHQHVAATTIGFISETTSVLDRALLQRQS